MSVSATLQQSNSRRSLQRFFGRKHTAWALGTIVFLIAASIVGPWLLPYDQLAINMKAKLLPPLSGWHLLGTDQLGRDLLTRLLMAGRISLFIGFSAMLVSLTIGASIGVIAGYVRGRVGSLLMRVVDAMLCFPSIFFLLAVSAFTRPSVIVIALLIALTSWMEVARIVESQTRSIRERDFVKAAQMFGGSTFYIVGSEILPNVISAILVAGTLTMARAVLIEAYISFLGYGIQPPMPSWGNLLNNAQQYLTSAPWLAICPGVLIILAVASFNFVADGLRNTLDVTSGRT